MRRWIIAAMGVGLIATACSKKSSDTTGPGEGSGSTIPTEQTLADMISGSISDPAFLIPARMINALGRAAFCAGYPTGDFTDADSDGVSVNVTWSVDCDFRNNASHVALQGVIQGIDDNDGDPWVGRISISNPNASDSFFHYLIEGSTTSLHLWFQGGIAATRRGPTTYEVQADLFERVQLNDTLYGTLHYVWNASFHPQDTSWNPGSGSRSIPAGQLDLNGSIDYTSPQGNTIQGMTVETLFPIFYDSNCGDYDGAGRGPASGEIRVTWPDGQNVLVIEVTGCNQFQATYNRQYFSVNPIFFSH